MDEPFSIWRGPYQLQSTQLYFIAHPSLLLVDLHRWHCGPELSPTHVKAWLWSVFFFTNFIFAQSYSTADKYGVTQQNSRINF